jgi:hypothetical protein
VNLFNSWSKYWGLKLSQALGLKLQSDSLFLSLTSNSQLRYLAHHVVQNVCHDEQVLKRVSMASASGQEEAAQEEWCHKEMLMWSPLLIIV